MEKQEICFNVEKTGISKGDWLSILNVFRKQPLINEVILYGSRAKGNYKMYSDIDITIKGALDLMQLQEVENNLELLNLPYTFDVSQNHIIKNQDLLDHIQRVGITIYKR